MKSTIGLVVAALALLAQSAFAQTPPANAALTTQDTFEIENLIARYAHGFDSGAQTGFMWADVFTPDGVFMDGSGREYRGRDAIAQFGSGGPNSRKTPTSIGHFITNIVIDATSSGASARSYVMIGGGGGRGRGAGPADGPPPAPSFGFGGTYFDTLIKTPVGWRIRERVLVRPGTTADAVRAATTAGPAPASPGAAPAWWPSTAMALTADDYATLLHAQFTEDAPVVNVHLMPAANGVVVKAYRMRVDTAGAAPAIGPEGIWFSFYTRNGSRWQRADRQYLPAGTPLPASAQPYATLPPTMELAPSSSAETVTTLSVSAADYAQIRQLYARTAHGDDGAEPHRFYYNVRVERTSSGFTGRALVLLASLGGAAPGPGRAVTVSAVGATRDELVKTASGWQFKTRAVDWRAGNPSPR